MALSIKQLDSASLPNKQFHLTTKCCRFKRHKCPNSTAQMCYYTKKGKKSKIVMRCEECQEEGHVRLNWEVIKLDAKERFYILLK